MQTLLRCPYSPRVQSHASTSVCTLKISNTGSHTLCEHTKILHTPIRVGSDCRLLCAESRRDQDEGGELGSHEELRHFCGVQARSRGGVLVLDPQVSPEEIKSREVELGLKGGLLLHQLFPNSGATDIVFVTVLHSSWDSNCVVH